MKTMLNQHHIPGQNHTKGAHIYATPNGPIILLHITLHPLSLSSGLATTALTNRMHGSRLQVSYTYFRLSWIHMLASLGRLRTCCDL